MNLLNIILLYISTCLQLDVVIVADVSQSVSGEEKFISNAILDFTNKFKNTDVRTSVVTFSDRAVLHYHLGDTVRFNIYVDGGTTNMSDGVLLAAEELFSVYSMSNNKMIIIISDGDPNNKAESKLIIERIKKMGVGFCGVLIDSGSRNSGFMKEISDVYVETNYKLLSEELKKLNLCL